MTSTVNNTKQRQLNPHHHHHHKPWQLDWKRPRFVKASASSGGGVVVNQQDDDVDEASPQPEQEERSSTSSDTKKKKKEGGVRWWKSSPLSKGSVEKKKYKEADDSDNNSSGADSDDEQQEETLIVIHHAAAAVTYSEANEILLPDDNNNNNNSSDDDDDDDYDDSPSSSSSTTYVISVTLLSSSSSGGGGGTVRVVADKLRIELLRQQQQQQQKEGLAVVEEEEEKEHGRDGAGAGAGEEESFVCLESRLLQWPASALRGSSGGDGTTIEEEEGGGRQPKQQQQQQPKYQHLQEEKEEGLVAVTFCRRAKPREQPRPNRKTDESLLFPHPTTAAPSSQEQHHIQDTIDLLQLLSLGGEQQPPPEGEGEATTPTPNSPPDATSTPNKTAGSNPVVATAKAAAASTASENQQQQQPTQPSFSSYNDDDDDEEAAAIEEEEEEELLLACLNNTGEVHMYSPMDLLLSKTRRGGEGSSESSPPPGSTREDDFARLLFGDDVFRAVQERMLPLSEPLHTMMLPIYQSLLTWDPALDPQTLAYQTRKNRATHILPAGKDFICIAGTGQQQQRLMKQQKQKPRRKEVQTPPSAKLSRDDDVSLGGHSKDDDDDNVSDYNEGTNESTTSRIRRRRQADGSFLYLYYTHNLALVRIFYFPFVLQQVSVAPMHGRTFLLVVGEAEGRCQAVAVCLDANLLLSSTTSGPDPHLRAVHQQLTPIYEGEPSTRPELGSVGPNPTTGKKDEDGGGITGGVAAYCRRFQVVPILLPTLSEEYRAVVASEYFYDSSNGKVRNNSVSSPELVMLFKQQDQLVVMQSSFRSLDIVSREELTNCRHILAKRQLRGTKEKLAAIVTEHTTAHTARIPLLATDFGHEGNDESLWCHVGQGWCLVGFSSSCRCLLVCWEGSTADNGAFVLELMAPSATVREPGDGNRRTIVAPILPIPNSGGDAGGMGSSQYDFPVLPFMGTSRRSEAFRGFNKRNEQFRGIRFRQSNSYEDSLNDDSPVLMDDIVLEALRSISSQNYRDTVLSTTSPRSPRHRSLTYTPSEKSVRLLRHCSSWTQLETSDGHDYLDLQVPVLTVRFEATSHRVLTLRKVVVDNGAAAPFQQVLSWMSKKKDYFAAASLALDLLQDSESLRFLWTTFEKINTDNEREKLEGLLDGIVPIRDEDVQGSTTTHLADMTVGCLTKGGFAMASTLEHFLEADQHYDTSRACLMLVATAANAISDDETAVMDIMGEGYHKDEQHAENILWPVRCLLKAAVARDRLVVAILLLNSTIPDELRHRVRGGIAAASMPSLELSISLISLIVASSPDAAELLLGVVDESTRLPFWESLQHEMQLEVSLILIDDKAPMLRQPEVRCWALQQLQNQIDAEVAIRDGHSIVDVLPTPWLKRLCMACLFNAGCLVEVAPATPTSDPETPQTESDFVEQHGTEIYRARNVLTPERMSGGLDFDLFIPALLILQHRNVDWDDDKSPITTRSILNAACFLAGRSTREQPMFTLDSATLMRQCTLVDDVQAGANLVGGKNAVILECCDVLIRQGGLTMDQAEAFLLSEPMRVIDIGSNRGSADNNEMFMLQAEHAHILWLLEEHVLGVETYGDLESRNIVRGKVDPIFATKICLRTWWFISRSNTEEATRWLTTWLRGKLRMTTATSTPADSPIISPRRLACAALTRALVWPASSPDNYSHKPEDTLLAARLEMPSSFLVELARSCCGLAESLPPREAEKAWSMNKSSLSSSSPLPAKPINREGSGSISLISDNDDSFTSAAAYLDS